MPTSNRSSKAELGMAWACSQYAGIGGVHFRVQTPAFAGCPAGLSRLSVPRRSGLRAALAAAALTTPGVWELIELGFANNSSDE